MPELVDLVDKHGEVQKLAVPRHEVDQHDGLHMQIVIIVIFDSLGRMLVHRRGKEPHIGHIDHICGGLASGESPLDAATREALEEVGVTPRNLRVVDTRVNEYDRYRHLLIGETDETPHIASPDEVQWVGLLHPDELHAGRNSGDLAFVDGFFGDIELVIAGNQR